MAVYLQRDKKANMALVGFAGDLAKIARQDGFFKAEATTAIKSTLVKNVSNSLVRSIFENTPIAIRDGSLSFHNGEVSFSKFFNLFRRGYSLDAIKLISRENIPASAARYLERQSAIFPEQALEVGRRISNNLPELAGKTGEAELEAVARTSPRVRNILKTITSKISNNSRFVGFSVAVVASGLTIYGLTEHYRREMTGCFRYETVNGRTVACKVERLSCNTSNTSDKPKTDITYCQDSQLTHLMTLQSCIDNEKKDHCKMCDSDITDKNDPNFINDRMEISASVTYKCRTPDLAEALGDMVQNYSTAVVDEVTAAVKTGGSIFKYVIYAIIIAFGAGVIYYLFSFFRSKSAAAPRSIPYTRL